MTPRPRSSAVLALLALLVLAGCARALPPPRQPIAEPAERALTLLARRWYEFRDLRTLAEVDVRRGSERRRLLAVIVARAPASMRLEALSPLGHPLLVALVHDRRVMTYNAATNEAMVGPATAETAVRLLSLPFEPDDLVGILAGRPAPPRDVRVAEILPADGEGPSLMVVGGDHEQRIWMDFTTGIVRQLEITGGLYEVRVTYERAADGTVTGLAFAAPRGDLAGRLRYREPVVNAGVDSERFRLTLPETAKIEHLR